MRDRLRNTVVALALVVPAVSAAQEPDAPAPAPSPAPVVPAPLLPAPQERGRRLPGLPAPLPGQGGPGRLAPSAVLPPNTPTSQCGMRVVPVDPSADPAFVKPVPEGPVRFAIRELPVPCAPTTATPGQPVRVTPPAMPNAPAAPVRPLVPIPAPVVPVPPVR